MRVIWGTQEAMALKEIYDYIGNESLQNTENVRDTIIESGSRLDGKITHRPDKYKTNNDGTYRVYQILSYRISYRITATEIKILRLRHEKTEPKIF